MLIKTKKIILSEYDAKSGLYLAYGQKLQFLIEEILNEAGISFHSVSFRCKKRDSLEKKLEKQDAAYKSLSDITDICGVRVITYFDDEVKKASKLLEAEFNIDAPNSSDKADSLDPDRFGYLSIHYIVKNGDERNKLTEYKRFSDIKAEVQVRSILQHAWAEIEHDLGYKSPDGIPRQVRRRFSRLAGLLELADQEFRTIREELSLYSSNVLTTINKSPAEVDLNAISLRAMVSTSNIVERIDLKIANAVGGRIFDYGHDDYDKEVRRLIFFGMRTIDEVSNLLSTYEDIVVKFAKKWVGRTPNEEDSSFSPGISLFYLCYVLSAQTNDIVKMLNYVINFISLDEEQSAENLVEEIKETYKGI